MIQRDFCAERPNGKCLIDIIEFVIPAGRVYLSPIIDCFDGMPVCWHFGLSPNAENVNETLEDAISELKVGEHTYRQHRSRLPLLLSQLDQRLEQAQLQRSMSKKI